MQPLFGPHRHDLGWGELATGGVNVQIVPGNHVTWIAEPIYGSLAVSTAQLSVTLNLPPAA